MLQLDVPKGERGRAPPTKSLNLPRGAPVGRPPKVRVSLWVRRWLRTADPTPPPPLGLPQMRVPVRLSAEGGRRGRGPLQGWDSGLGQGPPPQHALRPWVLTLSAPSSSPPAFPATLGTFSGGRSPCAQNRVVLTCRRVCVVYKE